MLMNHESTLAGTMVQGILTDTIQVKNIKWLSKDKLNSSTLQPSALMSSESIFKRKKKVKNRLVSRTPSGYGLKLFEQQSSSSLLLSLADCTEFYDSLSSSITLTITPGRSSKQHPVSAKSGCKSLLFGHTAAPMCLSP